MLSVISWMLGFRDTYLLSQISGINRASTVEERLDYALSNTPWREIWPFINVRHLCRHMCDHNPLLLDFYVEDRRGARRSRRVHFFCFEEMWLRNGDE